MSEYNEDFEMLRRLLVLKRHEVPPPGYFEDFSSQVMARIRAGDTGESEIERLPWLLRFLQAFEARPAYPVAFASALCCLLLFGIVAVEQNPEAGSVWSPTASGSYVADVSASSLTSGASPQLGTTSNTNPPASLPPAASLFGTPQSNPYVHPISLTQPAN